MLQPLYQNKQTFILYLYIWIFILICQHSNVINIWRGSVICPGAGSKISSLHAHFPNNSSINNCSLQYQTYYRLSPRSESASNLTQYCIERALWNNRSRCMAGTWMLLWNQIEFVGCCWSRKNIHLIFLRCSMFHLTNSKYFRFILCSLGRTSFYTWARSRNEH